MTALNLETVDCERVDGVAWVSLNRPEALNAWIHQLGVDLQAALDTAADDPDVRAIVFTGAGRAFSSGADLKAGGELQKEGGSFDLLTLVAARSAYFLLAFVNIGLGLDGGASQSPAVRVGHGRAMEMAMLGERIGAEQALDWGLANRVVDDEQLHAAVTELAQRLAAGPPGSYATIKRTINARTYDGFAESLDLEAQLQQERADSKDFMEGVVSFIQKRPPTFTGE